jgi:hypothetical protein
MARAGEAGELLLELEHLRPQDEGAVREHALDTLLDSPPEPGTLRLKINEGNRTE